MSSPSSAAQISGPPYAPTTAALGGLPVPEVDDPISAVLILLYILSAATHMGIFQTNNRKSHKFVFSAMLFGFSMARIAALTMRIVWASRSTNVSIAIAANILAQAGVVIIFIANLFFAQRIVRGYHPGFGWHNGTRLIFRGLVGSVIACLIMVIVATVQSFYTLDVITRQNDRIVQLVAGTYLAVLAFLPAPAVIIAALVPHATHVEKFGTGSWRAKMGILLFATILLSFGATFRVAVNYMPHPNTDPQWYHHKAAYYCVNYAVELIVSFTYAASRVDRRFHIPNGAKQAGDYAAVYGKNRQSSQGTDGTEAGMAAGASSQPTLSTPHELYNRDVEKADDADAEDDGFPFGGAKGPAEN